MSSAILVHPRFDTVWPFAPARISAWAWTRRTRMAQVGQVFDLPFARDAANETLKGQVGDLPYF